MRVFCRSWQFNFDCNMGNLLQKNHECSGIGTIWGQFRQRLWKLLQAQIPKSAKNTVKLPVFFVLLGFGLVKVVHRMLVKSSPDIWSYNQQGELKKQEEITITRNPDPQKWDLSVMFSGLGSHSEGRRFDSNQNFKWTRYEIDYRSKYHSITSNIFFTIRFGHSHSM